MLFISRNNTSLTKSKGTDWNSAFPHPTPHVKKHSKVLRFLTRNGNFLILKDIDDLPHCGYRGIICPLNTFSPAQKRGLKEDLSDGDTGIIPTPVLGWADSPACKIPF